MRRPRRPKSQGPNAHDLRAAATLIWQRLELHGICVELSQNSAAFLTKELPIDKFLKEMSHSPTAPSILFEPQMLGNQLWTKSITAYIYAGIERAFTRAARMPGGSRPGYVHELRALRSWVNEQLQNPERPVPQHFATKTAVFFANGILENRRPQRVELLQRLEGDDPSCVHDLRQLIAWIEEDLADERLTKMGRPGEYQSTIFVVEIANLWHRLTKQEISKNSESYFVRFLRACWQSGFIDENPTVNFGHILRHHLKEDSNSQRCERCECCKKSENCERKRYLGTLT